MSATQQAEVIQQSAEDSVTLQAHARQQLEEVGLIVPQDQIQRLLVVGAILHLAARQQLEEDSATQQADATLASAAGFVTLIRHAVQQ